MIFSKWIKLIPVGDSKKKEQIQAMLVKNHIAYKVKVKEAFRKNAYDTARLGSLGNNQVKLMYSFYVQKEQVDLAKHCLRDAGLL